MKNLLHPETDTNKPLIKNKTIEDLFLSVCTDSQMTQYLKAIKQGSTARATAYASYTVAVWFHYWRDRDARLGVDLEYTAERLFTKGKARRK